MNIASYPPLEERNRLVSSIESTSSTLSYSLSWQRFLTLEGARLPYEGDSLHYPPGTTLESLRQGLLTFNTYVSTLRLPTDYRPEPVEVWSEGSISPLGSRRFFVGQCFRYCIEMVRSNSNCSEWNLCLHSLQWLA